MDKDDDDGSDTGLVVGLLFLLSLRPGRHLGPVDLPKHTLQLPAVEHLAAVVELDEGKPGRPRGFVSLRGIELSRFELLGQHRLLQTIGTVGHTREGKTGGDGDEEKRASHGHLTPNILANAFPAKALSSGLNSTNSALTKVEP